MSIEITIIVTIISASIALASLIITGQNGLRTEMREQRIEIQGQRKEMQEGEKHSKEIHGGETRTCLPQDLQWIPTSGSGWTHPSRQPWQSPPRTTAQTDHRRPAPGRPASRSGRIDHQQSNSGHPQIRLDHRYIHLIYGCPELLNYFYKKSFPA